jgi:hypothetical protein
MGGLGSLLPLLLLSGMGGMGVSPALIQNIQEEKKQSLEKWKSAIRLMLTLILGWVFVGRSTVTAKDAAGNPVYSLEGIQKTNEEMFRENQYANFIKESVLAGVDTIFELLKPSASESLLFQAILGNSRPAAGNTTIVQAAQPAPYYPGGYATPPMGGAPTYGSLRNTRIAAPPRAQGGVVMPDGTVVYE